MAETDETVDPLNAAAALAGKTVVVTGAAQGLGEATSRLAHARGATVALLDIDADRADAVAQDLDPSGTTARAFSCDISDEQAVASTADAVAATFGPCHGLVNNAGTAVFAPLEEHPLSAWEQVMRVNVTGAFLCMQCFGRQMIQQRGGSIVNVGSIAADTVMARGGSYGPSKAAVVQLAKLAAVEWGRYGVRANTVSPAQMNTPLAAPHLSQNVERRHAIIALRRISEPVEVARVIAFLLSDDAAYVTGQDIQVDGGTTLMLLETLHPEAQ